MKEKPLALKANSRFIPFSASFWGGKRIELNLKPDVTPEESVYVCLLVTMAQHAITNIEAVLDFMERYNIGRHFDVLEAK